MSPGKAAPPISGENLEENEEETEKDQRRRIVSLTPEETLDESEDISTSTIIPTTGISASDNEDSEFPSVLEVAGYLAALPLLLAISPFLLLGLAVILLPLLAGSSLLLIVMVLAGSAAIMLPVFLDMPSSFQFFSWPFLMVNRQRCSLR